MYCEYGSMMEEMICDQLVLVVNSDGMRKRLLADLNLNLRKAIELISLEEQMESLCVPTDEVLKIFIK